METDILKVHNTKDLTSSPINILACAPVGAGKTTQILTLPGKKFLYIFDPNTLPSLEGHDVDYRTFVPDITDLDISAKTLKVDKSTGKVVGDRPKGGRLPEPTTYRDFEDDYTSRLDAGFFNKYDWLCFDSITTLSEIILDRIQWLNGRLGKHPEQADYTAEMAAVRNVIRCASGMTACNLYVTGHVETIKDDSTGKTFNQPLITGRNRIRVPMRFSQIYALEGKDGGYSCQTQSDRWYPFLRTNIKNLKPVEDITLDWKMDLTKQGLGRFVTRQTRR